VEIKVVKKHLNLRDEERGVLDGGAVRYV